VALQKVFTQMLRPDREYAIFSQFFLKYYFKHRMLVQKLVFSSGKIQILHSIRRRNCFFRHTVGTYCTDALGIGKAFDRQRSHQMQQKRVLSNLLDIGGFRERAVIFLLSQVHLGKAH
jgi:hypothetical protein